MSGKSKMTEEDYEKVKTAVLDRNTVTNVEIDTLKHIYKLYDMYIEVRVKVLELIAFPVNT
jgi:hypothetical protein